MIRDLRFFGTMNVSLQFPPKFYESMLTARLFWTIPTWCWNKKCFSYFRHC